MERMDRLERERAEQVVFVTEEGEAEQRDREEGWDRFMTGKNI